MSVTSRLPGALLALLAAIALAACNVLAPAPDTSTKALMPKPAGYTYIDLTAKQGDVINIVAGGAAVTGNLQVAAAAKVIGEVANCYQKAGAYEAAAYQSQTDLLQVGGVLLINNTVLSNPAVLLNCFTPHNNAAPAQQPDVMQPCVRRADFSQDSKNYTAFVGGSNPGVCDTLCSLLPGGIGVCRSF